MTIRQQKLVAIAIAALVMGAGVLAVSVYFDIQDRRQLEWYFPPEVVLEMRQLVSTREELMAARVFGGVEWSVRVFREPDGVWCGQFFTGSVVGWLRLDSRRPSVEAGGLRRFSGGIWAKLLVGSWG